MEELRKHELPFEIEEGEVNGEQIHRFVIRRAYSKVHILWKLQYYIVGRDGQYIFTSPFPGEVSPTSPFKTIKSV